MSVLMTTRNDLPQRRFREGMEHSPGLAASARVGCFADGLATTRPTRVGCFADGLATTRPTRVGSFADTFVPPAGPATARPRLGVLRRRPQPA
jgi:hypothetical protein